MNAEQALSALKNGVKVQRFLLLPISLAQPSALGHDTAMSFRTRTSSAHDQVLHWDLYADEQVLEQPDKHSWFIETVIAHIASLVDYFKLWQRHIIQSPHVAMSSLPFDKHINNPVQSRFMTVFKLLLRKRDEH